MAAENNSERMDMTPETKAYLDQQFAHLEQRILDITNPIKEKLEDLRTDIIEIYGRIGTVETKVAILEDNKGSRQNNTGTILVIISIVAGLLIGAIGFLI